MAECREHRLYRDRVINRNGKRIQIWRCKDCGYEFEEEL